MLENSEYQNPNPQQMCPEYQELRKQETWQEDQALQPCMEYQPQMPSNYMPPNNYGGPMLTQWPYQEIPESYQETGLEPCQEPQQPPPPLYPAVDHQGQDWQYYCDPQQQQQQYYQQYHQQMSPTEAEKFNVQWNYHCEYPDMFLQANPDPGNQTYAPQAQALPSISLPLVDHSMPVETAESFIPAAPSSHMPLEQSAPKGPPKMTDKYYKFSKVINQLLKKRLLLHQDVTGISYCNLCGGYSLSQDRRGIFSFMKQHVFTHVQQYPFTCLVCKEYESTNSSKVKAHIHRVHGIGSHEAEKFMKDKRQDLDLTVVEWAIKCYKDD